MTPDTFMDTFTLVRNRLERQDTQFREAFPIKKRIAIAFRSSHQSRSSQKKRLPEKNVWARASLSIKLQV